MIIYLMMEAIGFTQ